MHKVFAAALAFLALAPFGFAETAATSKPASPEVTITVYDYAHVSPELLQAAQGVARKTFWQAGIESSWVTCLPKPEKVQSHDCYFLDATHLTVKLSRVCLLRSRPKCRGCAQARSRLVGQRVGSRNWTFVAGFEIPHRERDHVRTLERRRTAENFRRNYAF